MSDVVATIDVHGRIVVPKRIRESLGVGAGDQILLRSTESRVVMTSINARRDGAIAELRREIDRLAPGRSLSEELIRERRAEADRE